MKSIKNTKDTYFKIIPLALILLVVPLIVFMKTVTIEGSYSEFYSSKTIGDFFNSYKTLYLFIFTIGSVLFTACYAYFRKFKFKLALGFIPLFVYYLLVFLSTSYSKYHDVAFNGFVERFEGFWVISCYVMVCFIAAHFITYEKDIKLLIGALTICTILLCVLGMSQYFGYDFLQTDFMKKAMLPTANQDLSSSLDFKFPTKYIYLTLFNPNYVGSFCAIVLPLCITLLLFTKKIHLRVLYSVLSIAVLATLIGSRSSAGYVGALVSLLFLVILLRRRLLKYWIPVLGLIILGIAGILFINHSSPGMISSEIQGFIPQKQTPTVYKDGENNFITDMTIDKNIMTIYKGDTPLNIKFNSEDKTLDFLDETGTDVKVVENPDDTTILTFDNPKYIGMSIKITGSLFEITGPNTKYYVNLYNTGSFMFLSGAGKPVDIVNPASFGFEGYERWASSRGYILSRSIPLLKDTVFLGHGPDTYPMYFPQNDFKGKLQYLDTPYILVDKPHNMFLQIAINTGVVSLIAFLVFVLWYIISSFILYFRPKKSDSFYYMAGSACVLAVIGFLVAGLANDSTVNVSPIFWILLGIGFSCNRLYKKELSVAVNGSSIEKPATKKVFKKSVNK